MIPFCDGGEEGFKVRSILQKVGQELVMDVFEERTIIYRIISW